MQPKVSLVLPWTALPPKSAFTAWIFEYAKGTHVNDNTKHANFRQENQGIVCRPAAFAGSVTQHSWNARKIPVERLKSFPVI